MGDHAAPALTIKSSKRTAPNRLCSTERSEDIITLDLEVKLGGDCNGDRNGVPIDEDMLGDRGGVGDTGDVTMTKGACSLCVGDVATVAR
mmetsp:Transcript_97448/g.275653  ORF Transcript_97448/g.275653 Transcript_97448/m.275653 type:complete len:90 (-) Transcript_97448:182-451(-)